MLVNKFNVKVSKFYIGFTKTIHYALICSVTGYLGLVTDFFAPLRTYMTLLRTLLLRYGLFRIRYGLNEVCYELFCSVTSLVGLVTFFFLFIMSTECNCALTITGYLCKWLCYVISEQSRVFLVANIKFSTPIVQLPCLQL